MATKKQIQKVFKAERSLYNIRSRYCTNNELSDQFISDLLMVTGYEIDEEGYIVDPEDDPIEPEYVQVKGRVLRVVRNGILHSTDLVFDPYNNITIMEEMFKHYLATSHTEVSSTQIHAADPNVVTKLDTYGYMTILYSNGATIKTGLHYKDSTKYLDAFMRLESMVDKVVMDRLKPYDEYEAAFFKEFKTMNPMIAAGLKK